MDKKSLSKLLDGNLLKNLATGEVVEVVTCFHFDDNETAVLAAPQDYNAFVVMLDDLENFANVGEQTTVANDPRPAVVLERYLAHEASYAVMLSHVLDADPTKTHVVSGIDAAHWVAA